MSNRACRRSRSASSVLAEALEKRTFLSASPYVVLSGTPATGQILVPSTDISQAYVQGSNQAYTQYQIYEPADTSTPDAIGGRTPAQIRKSYGIGSISFNGVTGDGTGQTIAIVDAYDDPSFVSSTNSNFLISDLHRFDTQFGIADPPSFKKVSQTGSQSSLPVYNADWDTEIALDVEWVHSIAPNANIVLVEAKTNSNSDLETAIAYAKTIPNVAAISMSFGGGEDSSDPSENSLFTTPNGQNGITFLASTGDDGAPGGTPSFLPNVVAIGGTKLTQANSTGTYSSESGWTDGGGGISVYESKPTYQTYITTPSTTKRTIPDVSMDADPNSGVAVLDTSAGGIGSTAAWGIIGGTSLACPIWAGLIGIADQGRSLLGLTSLNGITQTLPRLYTLNASDFHDITTGNNGFAAKAGYDLVTGRGTPIADQLIPDLAGGVTLTGTIFNDTDMSGVQNGGEAGMNHVTVFLDYNGNGVKDSSEPSTTTDSSGSYTFTDLPGNAAYSVRAVTPSGYFNTSPLAVSAASSYGQTLTDNFGFHLIVLTANAGGPYTVAEGSSITLSAASSTGNIVSYQWDTNYDGVTFNPVATGATLPFDASAIDGPATRTIALQVTDSANATLMDVTTITITDAPPTATLSTSGISEGSTTGAVTFNNPTDPSPADLAAGFTYSYDFDNDGTFEITDSTSPTATIPSALLADGPSTFQIRGRITDKDGGYTDYTKTVTVTDAPPTATFAAPTNVPQGSSATLTFTNATDPSAADVSAGFTYSYDFNNDGTFDVVGSSSATATIPSTTVGDTPGVRTVRARIIDKDGGYTDYTTTYTVVNVAPTATLVTTAGDEGSNFVVTLTAPFDPSASDTAAGFKYSFDLNNDGSFEVLNSSSNTFSYHILDQGTYSILTRITDRNGGSTTYLATVTAANVAPASSITADTTVTEGSTATVTFGTVTDPSPVDTTAGFTYSYDFNNDGTFEITNSTDPSATVPASFLADGPSVRTIHARVTDKDGGHSDYTADIAVTNVDPTLSITSGDVSNLVFDAGYTLALTSHDPGTDTISSWTIDWGDSTSSHSSSASPSFNHNYAATGNYAITISATDEDGTYTLNHLVSVTSTPPTAAFIPGALASDKSSFQFTVSYDDDLGIQPSTIDSSDLSVTGPAGPVKAITLLSTTSTDNGRGVIATYQATGPVGAWDWEDDGTYSVSINSNQILDRTSDPVESGPIGSFSVSLIAPNAPDLVPQLPASIKLSPASKSNSLTVKIFNRGTRTLSPTNITTSLYLSHDPTWDSSDKLLATSKNKFGLIINQSAPVTFSFTTPKVAAGVYYLIVRTDTKNTLSERNERNNIAVSKKLSLTASPSVRRALIAATPQQADLTSIKLSTDLSSLFNTDLLVQ
ncbi:MAG TPA: SdrD B-like domain-containing protein [Tepidisphaeraceae bacterium]|jgi:hypothetical protein|nr:SdrD B-like domain-containing protein [Tepidisphaeraceae bacterium]